MESSGLLNPTWLPVCYTGDVIFTNGFLYYLRVVCHTEGQPTLGSTLGQADASIWVRFLKYGTPYLYFYMTLVGITLCSHKTEAASLYTVHPKGFLLTNG